MSDWHVYMLRCRDGALYTGIATDVARRLAEHAAGGRGAKSLRGRGPFELVRTWPAADRAAAQRLERRIQRLARSEKARLAAGLAPPPTSSAILPDIAFPPTIPTETAS